MDGPNRTIPGWSLDIFSTFGSCDAFIVRGICSVAPRHDFEIERCLVIHLFHHVRRVIFKISSYQVMFFIHISYICFIMFYRNQLYKRFNCILYIFRAMGMRLGLVFILLMFFTTTIAYRGTLTSLLAVQINPKVIGIFKIYVFRLPL